MEQQIITKKDLLLYCCAQVKELHWLPNPLPPQCKLVITTTSTDLTYKSLTLRPDVCTLPWPGLSDFWARRSILLKHLTLPYQEPPRNLLQSLLGRKLCRLPLALAAVASELQTCSVLRGEREEVDLLEEYVEINSMAELWAKVIQRWVKDYGGDHEGTPCPAKETGPHSQVSNTSRTILFISQWQSLGKIQFMFSQQNLVW